MTRWTLNRAGICNVYQYGDETLRFGDGRLLLRGVNGSGKSTAMNMLLPFLLEADTRRIDAAGEQAGVLRAWMLSGRDEAQPVGYLWIEFRRGDEPDAEYLVCGCGIRANRSTDRVTTWWFITPRRPGIDLALVDAKTPLSVDALRAELGSGAVFAQDQRSGYRAEIQRRLFGGADLDQHLRLLHIVRNPRVGDRIDVDLPTYLADALPQLSEAALDDAAQPLEDLEEHRRNVEDLTRTAAALDALDTAYGNYVRTELRDRAERALEQVAHARERRDALLERRSRHDEALADATRVNDEIARLEREGRRLGEEIAALTASDAYRAGAELHDLRHHVGSLDDLIAKSSETIASQARRTAAARDALVHAQRQSTDDLDAMGNGLSDLRHLAATTRLTAPVPEVPTIETTSPTTDIDAPTRPLDVDPTRRALAGVRAAVHSRSEDVREVRRLAAAEERAEAAVARVDALLHDAITDEERAHLATTAAREARDHEATSWREQLAAWTAALHAHGDQHALVAEPLALPPIAELVEQRDAVAAAHTAAAQAIVDHHAERVAALSATCNEQRQTLAERELELADLMQRAVPDAPLTPWQTPTTHPRLAECIDFAPTLDAAARAGLEAALEAASLLAAEVTSDGVRLADGQLVAGLGAAAVRSLHDLVVVTPPPDAPDPNAVTATVTQILRTISVDPAYLDAHDEQTTVTTDGRFRIGVLRGRHHKTEAEHIGLTARRARLERQRRDARAAVDLARAALSATEDELVTGQAAGREARTLRDARPSANALHAAVQRVTNADDDMVRAVDRTAARRDEHTAAEHAFAEATDTTMRVATTARLPHQRDDLDEIDRSLRDTTHACDRLDGTLTALTRSVQRWIDTARSWQHAVADAAKATTDHLELEHRREPLATKLATLEDAIGLEYEQIVAAIELSTNDQRTAADALAAQRQVQPEIAQRVGRLAAEVDTAVRDQQAAEATCALVVDELRHTLEVPGLVDAAHLAPSADAAHLAPSADAITSDASTDDAAPLRTLPAVERNAHGLRILARRIHTDVAPPDRPTSADSVRQSLRQRRDTLGAGWDAEDRQPSPDLPLLIEVTGPLGRMPVRDALMRVRSQLRSMASLLSAKQDQALRNLLQGLIAREVAEKLHAARELVAQMNRRLDAITTSHGIGVSLRWTRRDDLDESLATTIALLAKLPDLRTADEDQQLIAALSTRIANARLEQPDAAYRQLLASVLDYREWHRMVLVLRRPGRDDERLTRRTALSEGEKKMVSYLPLFAAVAASCDAFAEHAPDAPRFVLLDDAFAKVSEDNHPKLFGLLVELDLDFIATSERLWGTYATVPKLAITEVIRDAALGVIVLEHAEWDGQTRRDVR